MGWPDMLLRIAELGAVVIIAVWARTKVHERCTCNAPNTDATEE